ncbi:Peptide-N(4)-(N-acetyl-beta-D-glucosaminyl)asparagine amidase F precursor [compost metagenome]
MKKLILSGFLAVAALASFAQDTTWVQTYTFDTISTRRAEFQFPASLDTKRFEKVLMYYKLKCSPLTTWDQYNCGEWDYLTYTRIFEHTGIMDSVQVTGNKYRVNTLAPATYPYSNTVFYDQKWMQVQKRTSLVPAIHPISGTGSAPLTLVSSNGNGKTIQWIIPANELATSGVIAGDIQGMNLNILNAFASLQGVQIRIKSTAATSLTVLETTGFTTVFNNSLTGITAGSNTIHFSAPFTYDGASNLVIELKFTDARQGLPQIDMEMAAVAGSNTLSFDNSNGVFTANGTNYAEINLNNVNLGGDVTIAFWAKGNGNTGASTSIVEAADSLNNRIVNIHLPWSNDNIYWDAGLGSGYDRIQKTATAAADVDNAWHHWAFVKKTSTGQMFIYKDGVQWHSGTGHTRPIETISKFILGAGKDLNNNWKGSIDEFSIWSSALDAATISSWKDKKIVSSHPNYASLEVYYDFDGQLALIDRSGNNRLGMCSNVNMVQNNQPVIAGVDNTTGSPKIDLIQGTMNAATADSVLVTQFPVPSVVFEYEPGPHSFHVLSNMLTYDQGTIDTLASNGSVIQSVPGPVSATLTNQTIHYHEVAFEEINDIEIGRYITPYGIGFDLGPQGFTWIYDVTDYQKYLYGLVDLEAHNTQELIDLKFAFVEGIPARDVHDIQPVWQNWTSYNYADMANDAVMQAKQVVLSDTSQNFKIKTRLTGHGQVGAGACCEWQDKQHKILIDGVERFSWNIWRDDCGKNPNTAQGGTWPYAREGWCPGDMVAEFDHELSSFVQPGDTISVDYDISDVPANDPAQAGGNYITAIDLVSYSAPNFQHDAAILDILNPNSYEYYRKWNPTCSNPRVILQNNGALPLTSCKIRIWVSYGNFIDYTWTGNLAFLQKEVVEIPIANPHFWFGANPAGGFHARVIEIDGSSSLDEYEKNNEFKTKYTAPEVINGPFFVWMVTNNKANENKWRLVDNNGGIIYQRTTLNNNTDYKDTFNLAPGCYSIILEDSDDDGLGFWYSAQVEGETTGAFRVRKVGGSIVESFPPDFGSYHRYDFSVGFTLDLEEQVLNNELLIFPNPATEKIRVELVGNVGNNAKIEVIDMNGRVVKHQNVFNNNQTYAADFQVHDLQNGYYLVRVSGDNGSETTPFVKQ